MPGGNVRQRVGRAVRMPAVRTGAANLVLRVVTLAAKFGFLIILARAVSVEQMAVYGLFTTSIGISITLLGWEFYAFSTREILRAEGAERAVLVRDQLLVHLVGYAVLLPLAAPIFITGILDWRLAPWFYAVAVLEHLGHEATRLFNTLFRPVLSGALFFLRSAAWCIPVVAIYFLERSVNLLTLIWGGWALASLASLAISAYELRGLGWSAVRGRAVDWSWVRRGLLVAGPFMISAAAYRVIELADRYILHFLLGDEAVGIYSFFGTLANIIPALVGAGVTAVLVPHVVAAHQQGRMEKFRKEFRKLNVWVTAATLAAIPPIICAFLLLRNFFGKPEYAGHVGTFILLLFSSAASVLAQLPGVGLYARKDDRSLLMAVLLGAVVNLGGNFALIPLLGIGGAAWATVIAYAVMGGYQLHRFNRGGRSGPGTELHHPASTWK